MRTVMVVRQIENTEDKKATTVRTNNQKGKQPS